MNKILHTHKPAKNSSLNTVNLHYEDFDDNWRARAERLQDRKWHLLQRATRDRTLLQIGREV